MNTVTIEAAEPGYERIDYNPDVLPTIDGMWTNSTEWELNGEITEIGSDVAFRSVWYMVSFDPIRVDDFFLVEFFGDNTTDAEDYWQICIDGDQSGGGAPAAEDVRVDIVGHTDLTVYVGDGSGWVEDQAFDTNLFNWSDSIDVSPLNDTAHWILEFRFEKAALGAGPTWNFRLAAYDANTSTLAAWPPTSPDVPDEWGVQNYVSEVIPEGFSIIIVVLMSTVAIVVGFYCLRRRPRKESYSSESTGYML
jgi:hypothetical protein